MPSYYKKYVRAINRISSAKFSTNDDSEDDELLYTKVKGRFATNIAGISYPNDDGSSREEILGRTSQGEKLNLVYFPIPEDKNAVKVLRENGEQLGWLSRWNAAEIAPILKRGEAVKSEVLEIGKWKDDSGKRRLGCKILITKPIAVEELNTKKKKGKAVLWGCLGIITLLIILFIRAISCLSGGQ